MQHGVANTSKTTLSFTCETAIPYTDTVPYVNAKHRLATVPFMTTVCWWRYDGDTFKIKVTESICNILNVGDFSKLQT